MRPKCPCLGCWERKLFCHSRCELYKEWKKRIETEARARQKERDSWNNPERPVKYTRRKRQN